MHSILEKPFFFNKEQAQNKQKLYYDRFLHDSKQYAVGDWVKIKNYAKASGGQCQAFVEKFKGPYKIVSILDGLVFKLVSEDGKSEVVHYNRILPFHIRDDSKLTGSSEVCLPTLLDNGELVSNLLGVGDVVYMYKKKLKKKVAMNLLVNINGNADEQNISVINNDQLDDSRALNEEYFDISSTSDRNDGSEDLISDITTIEVTLVRYNELYTMSKLIKKNIKKKLSALCWRCEKWFEAKTGLRIHQRSCLKPMPTLSIDNHILFCIENNIEYIGSAVSENLDGEVVADVAQGSINNLNLGE